MQFLSTKVTQCNVGYSTLQLRRFEAVYYIRQYYPALLSYTRDLLCSRIINYALEIKCIIV